MIVTPDQIKPAIVVVGFNRPESLSRVLSSLDRGVYPQKEIPLVISLDYSGERQIQIIAEQFEWRYGPKNVIIHKEHLGLKSHIYFCGALTKEYEAIILLEDDLIVSPFFYQFALSALRYYSKEPKIAGVSLYSYEMTEGWISFRPLQLGFDTYFLQIPSSWGQAFTRGHWNDFESWIDRNSSATNVLPAFTYTWGDQSWKRIFLEYLIDTGRFFVYPYQSLSTNFGDLGTHGTSHGLFQVAVDSVAREFSFSDFDHSIVRYDAWFEPLPGLVNHFVPTLKDYTYDVDLQGTKNKIDHKWILTSRKGRLPIMRWSGEMQPALQNLIHHVQGLGIGLYRLGATDDCNDAASFLSQNQQRLSPKISIGLVIPMPNDQMDLLTRTLDSLDIIGCRNLEVLVACSEATYERVKIQLSKFGARHDLLCQVAKINADTTIHLAFEGLARLSTSLRMWIKPGVLMQEESIHQIQKVFVDYPGTCVALPLKNRKNWSLYRCNYSVFCDNSRTRRIFPSTQGMIFRGSVFEAIGVDFDSVSDTMRHAQTVKEICKRYWVYPIDIALDAEEGTFFLSETEILHIDLPSTGIQLKILSYLFRRFGRFKNKYIQGVFALVLDLPPIFRYDPIHDSFYQSTY